MSTTVWIVLIICSTIATVALADNWGQRGKRCDCKNQHCYTPDTHEETP